MKRILVIVSLVLLVLIAVVLIGAPYYAKSYIEKNSKELVGRQITMERLHFNTLNGHLLITDFKVFELDENTEFVQFDTLYVNMTLYKLLGGHVWCDAVHLKDLDIAVWKEDDLFNFTDLIPEVDSTEIDTMPTEDSFIDQFTFNDIHISNSSVIFEDRVLETKHDMKDIDIKLPGISIGDEQTTAGLAFSFANGGSFQTNLDYNLIENEYRWELEIDQLNLNPFTRYAREVLHINDMQGWFSGSVLVVGDIDEPASPIVSGSMNLNDFALTDTGNVEVFGFGQLFMDAEELNVATNTYHFGQLNINRPVINAIVTANGDNLRNLARRVEADLDTLVRKEKELSHDQTLVYILDEFRLNEGEMNIGDHTLQSGHFDYSMTSINFAADHLQAGHLVTFDMDAVMNGEGTLTGHVVTDPGNPGDGTFDFGLKNMVLADFSPYCIDATGFPIEEGLMSFQTENKIENKHLNSHIVLNMYNTELGDKRKDIDTDVNVPLKLGLVVLEDSKGRINIDVPAEGDIDDPDFRFSKLVWKVVLNVLVKAATSPYNLLAKSFGVDEEQLAFIRMEMLQEELGPEQVAQLDLIGNVLEDKPGLSITATLNMNESAEGDNIRDYIARKGYYLQKEHGGHQANVHISAVDKIKIMEIEEDDDFDHFLAQKIDVAVENHSRKELIDLYATEEKVKAEKDRLNTARRMALQAYLNEHPEVATRFKVHHETTFETGKKRPRFNLSYEVVESEGFE